MKSLRKIGGKFPIRIALLFLVSGALSLVISVFSESQILAFVGLGLVFWGFLFLLLRPENYVEGSLMESVVVAEYSTINRIIKDFKCEGNAYHVPPFPKDSYLPEHLKGLKELVVFISSSPEIVTPSIEEMAEGKFLLTKQKGVLVIPPGSGLLTKIEKQSRLDFTKIELRELCEVLPRFFTQDFNLAKAMEIKLLKNGVALNIFNSLYENLYRAENGFVSVGLLGCPIVSAVACALAKSSGKMIIIQKQELSSDGLTMSVWYQFGQG